MELLLERSGPHVTASPPLGSPRYVSPYPGIRRLVRFWRPEALLPEDDVPHPVFDTDPRAKADHVEQDFPAENHHEPPGGATAAVARCLCVLPCRCEARPHRAR